MILINSTLWQRGNSLVGMAFILIGVWCFFTLLFKVGPPYIGNWELQQTLIELDSKMRGTGYGAESVKSTLQYQIRDGGSYIEPIPDEGIVVKRSGEDYQVEVHYTVIKPLIGNLSFIMEFDETGMVKRR